MLGASNHSTTKRQNEDYYATDPKAAKLLLQLETFSSKIWEPACGEGHLSKVFIKAGFNVKSTDLINRGFGNGEYDFLNVYNTKWEGDIITNPPYTHAKEFIEKALQIIPKGNKVAMFLKVQFLEGQSRKKLFINTPPKIIYISSSRIVCALNGKFDNISGSAIAYAWYIWEKGYKKTTKVKWFN